MLTIMSWKTMKNSFLIRALKCSYESFSLDYRAYIHSFVVSLSDHEILFSYRNRRGHHSSIFNPRHTIEADSSGLIVSYPQYLCSYVPWFMISSHLLIRCYAFCVQVILNKFRNVFMPSGVDSSMRLAKLIRAMYTWYLLEDCTSRWPSTSVWRRKQNQIFIPMDDKLNYPHMLHARKYAVRMKESYLSGWAVLLDALSACSRPLSLIWGGQGIYKYALRYLASEHSNSSPSSLFEVSSFMVPHTL